MDITVLIQILFWASAAWLLYVFLGYPGLVAWAARVFPSPIRKSLAYEPNVTFVMAAYNEESIIARRLQNYLDLDYPREKLRFMIGSDSSTDRTDDIIREFQAKDGSIELRRFERSGKTKIVYTMAEEVESEVIVFCDADALLDRDGLRHMVSCFADPTVGGVVVRIVYEDEEENAGSVGERTYHGMEDTMRVNESMLHTTISPTGQCFGVRRGAYTPLVDHRMSDDLNLAITIPLNGKRVWFEPRVVVRETNLRNIWSEFRRRLRMGQQSMATFLRYDGTRRPWQSMLGFQIWSHKVLRNLAAIPAVLFVVASLMLYDVHPVYFGAAVVSLVWAAFVLIGLIVDRLKLDIPVIGYPLYFTMMILALTMGSLRAFVYGGGLAMWSSPRLGGNTGS